MKKHPVVITVLVFVLLVLTAFLLYRNIPALQLKVRRGLGCKILAHLSPEEGMEVYLSGKNGEIHLDAYLKQKDTRTWFPGSLTRQDGNEKWEVLQVFTIHIVENAMFRHYNYTIVAREADEKAYSGALDLEGGETEVLLIEKDGTYYQLAIACVITGDQAGYQNTPIKWEVIREELKKREINR